MFVMIAGFFGGIIGDALYNTQRLPGFDQPTGIPDIKWADFGQLAFYFFLLFIGLINQRKDLGNFAYGLVVGKASSSILFKAVGIPRYIFYDVDASGKLVPVRDIVDRGVGQLRSDVNEVLKTQNNVV